MKSNKQKISYGVKQEPLSLSLVKLIFVATIITSIGITLLIGATGYFLTKPRIEPVVSSPIVTPTPAPTIEDEISDLSSKALATEDWKTYRNPEFKYSIKYPQGWEIETSKDLGIVTLKESSSNDTITIGKQEGSPNTSLEDNIDYLKNSLEENKYAFKELNEIEISGGKVFLDLSTPDFVKQVYLVNKSGIFTVIYHYYKYSEETEPEKEKFLLEKFIPNFEFKDELPSEIYDVANWKTYKNEKYGFSFLYNPDWKVVPSENSRYFIPSKEVKDRIIKLYSLNRDFDKNWHEVVLQKSPSYRSYDIIIWDKDILEKLDGFYKDNPEELEAPTWGWYNAKGWNYWYEKFTSGENDFTFADEIKFGIRIKKENNEWLMIESFYKEPGGNMTSIKYITFKNNRMYEITYRTDFCGFPEKEIKNKKDFEEFLANCEAFSKESLDELDKFILNFKFIEKDETADWQTYNAPEFSFKYPLDWEIRFDVEDENEPRFLVLGNKRKNENRADEILINLPSGATKYMLKKDLPGGNIIMTESKNEEVLKVFEGIINTFKIGNYNLDCTNEPENFQAKYSWYNHFKEQIIKGWSLNTVCYNSQLNKVAYLKSKIDWENYKYDPNKSSYGLNQLGVYDIKTDDYEKAPAKNLGFYEDCDTIKEWKKNNEIIYQCGAGDAGFGSSWTYSYNSEPKKITVIEECTIEAGRDPEEICVEK